MRYAIGTLMIVHRYAAADSYALTVTERDSEGYYWVQEPNDDAGQRYEVHADELTPLSHIHPEDMSDYEYDLLADIFEVDHLNARAAAESEESEHVYSVSVDHIKRWATVTFARWEGSDEVVTRKVTRAGERYLSMPFNEIEAEFTR